MKHLCDSNVFVALVVGNHVHHEPARRWFESLNQCASAGFCRASQTSFLRLLTRPIAPGYEPVTNARAWEIYDLLSQDDTVTWEPEPAAVDAIWRTLATPKSVSPKVWMDAWLAAFAIAGNYQLVTFDRDFQKYVAHGLSWNLLSTVSTS